MTTGASTEIWQDELKARAEHAWRRRSQRAEERRLMARRRAHGLIDRNALRLAEARKRAAPP